jgi:hypothetical protein
MTVTACLVTRNHAASVGRAVASVQGLADRVLVSDTGSTDSTVADAQAAGAEVLAAAWADDFAAVCNQALDAATGDWILWLNPDEEFTPADAPLLTAGLADESAFAFTLRVRQQLRPDDPDRGTTGREPRLFRRDPAVRYVGRLHPDFVTPLEQIAASRGQQVKALEATVVRHAYLSTPTPDKLRWVVRLLEAELKDRPDRLECKIELGRNLLWLNDARGHALLAEAAATVAALPRAKAAPHPMVGMLLEYVLAADPGRVRTALSVPQAHTLTGLWFSRTPPVLWAAAQERYRAGDFPAAAKYLETLLDLGRSGWYESMSFDPDIIGPAAAANLGACYLQMNNLVLARACFEHVTAHPTFGAAARKHLAEINAHLKVVAES